MIMTRTSQFLIYLQLFLWIIVHSVHGTGTTEGLCQQVGDSQGEATKRSGTICETMKPRGGSFPPQTTECPWQIFLSKNTLENFHAQPVTLGGSKSGLIFNGYLLTARKISDSGELGEMVGHFESQWDAAAVCCNGVKKPNLLDGSTTMRVKKPNQTVLWTAPEDYTGKVVLIATFWESVQKYWPDIRSPALTIIPRVKRLN